jgi:hypothetical protein
MLWVQMRFQMPSHIVGQPRFVRDQEVEAELIVGQPNGEEAPVDYGDDLEGRHGQSPGHVQIVQDTGDVAGFDQDQIAVILGAVFGVIGDDQ